MSSPASTDILASAVGGLPIRRGAARELAPPAGTPQSGPRSAVRCVGLLAFCAALGVLSACSTAPSKLSEPNAALPTPQGAPPEAAPASSSSVASLGGKSQPVPPRAQADFSIAVNTMRRGDASGAELEFKLMTEQYPQLAAPFVNLGILYRKSGQLDQSEQALKTAVEHNDGSAVAWTELGATQRMRGEFKDAEQSYERAIAADPQYAPAYRNLGVVSDLYLGDPERALTAFERYKQLTGEDKPVSNWIAELRQRTGKPPVKPAAPAAAPSESPPPSEKAPPSGQSSGDGSTTPQADAGSPPQARE